MDSTILKYTGSEYTGETKNGRLEGEGEFIFKSGKTNFLYKSMVQIF